MERGRDLSRKRLEAIKQFDKMDLTYFMPILVFVIGMTIVSFLVIIPWRHVHKNGRRLI